MVAAKKMQKKIQDQLEESNASKHLRNTAFEMALFGTGVMKGPFAVDKEYPHWNDDGEYRSEEHTSELQSPVPISYAVFCLKKKKIKKIKIKNKFIHTEKITPLVTPQLLQNSHTT